MRVCAIWGGCGLSVLDLDLLPLSQTGCLFWRMKLAVTEQPSAECGNVFCVSYCICDMLYHRWG